MELDIKVFETQLLYYINFKTKDITKVIFICNKCRKTVLIIFNGNSYNNWIFCPNCYKLNHLFIGLITVFVYTKEEYEQINKNIIEIIELDKFK